MDQLPMQVFLTSVVLIFLAFSVYSTVIWLQSTPKLKTILNKTSETHWSYRWTIYYGIAFAIFLVASVFISFVVFLAIRVWGA